MGLMFFPRGGSAQVARYLGRALGASGVDLTLATGSLGGPGEPAHAATFFEGLAVHPVPYDDALRAADPLLAERPMHPSYEQRADAPDRVFAAVAEDAYEHLVTSWQRELEAAGAADADVLHLHHLTPLNEAAARSFPDIPVVGHLHGTELLMLSQIDAGAPEGWDHADEWAARMREWAQRCERLLVLSPDAVRRVPPLLGVEPERIAWAPNGFDPVRFTRRPLLGDERLALWRRWLVEEPRGWAPGGEPGSVAYGPEDLAAFEDGPVLLYVGRFTDVKRIPLVIEAHRDAREHFERPAPLVLLGGYPGEWEGEHPADTIERLGARDVFLAGWRGHEDLPDGLNAADVVVLPSVREQFGQVLIEAMACGLPVIAADAHGPAHIVDHGQTGWLVKPDDASGLGTALVEAVNDPDRRRRKGRLAYEESRGRYAWPALAEGVAAIYEDVIAERGAPLGVPR